ncbi:Pre-rRNA-processing protein ESF2 [Golovinomyces cichoracearum]|uniref:18S rRNA factor 2 n=1 Tax=Golovinomyces cichoracearum TaxID=62708 RepID=A0A420IJZ4_9PEZI|nr:Pre-rRNA-processing protein ESF2 [Golovinomyces cichoracearum]
MLTRKHNEFLDLDESENDKDTDYESDVDNIKKGGRSLKRRKIEVEQSEDEDSGTEETKEESHETTDEKAEKPLRPNNGDEIPGVSKPLLKKNLVATSAAIKRSGVVYLSRIPPYMKPSKLRSLLEPYGKINRIFLTPEDATSHSRRVRNGGNKKRSFVDGWVEFVKKSDAKAACELLNARIIGGKKGTYYHDDVWNLLYLKGFKWNNLTEQIAAENAERASRMRAEISRTTKENKEFLQNVERAKMLQGMKAKRVKGVENENTESTDEYIKKGTERARHFKQRAVASKKSSEIHPEQVERILRKIF